MLKIKREILTRKRTLHASELEVLCAKANYKTIQERAMFLFQVQQLIEFERT